MSAAALAALMVALVAAALGCEPADLVDCGPGTYVRGEDGGEYCVYPTLDASGSTDPEARCPPELPVLTEFPGGLVCATREVGADELPELVGAGLRTVPDGGAEPGAPACGLAPETVLGPGDTGSVPEMIALSSGGFAVAWGGTLWVLSSTGDPVESHAIGSDGSLGYAVAELEGDLVVARFADDQIALSRPARSGLEELVGTEVASGPAMMTDAAGDLWLAERSRQPGSFQTVIHRLDSATLAPAETWETVEEPPGGLIPEGFSERPAIARSGPALAVAELDYGVDVFFVERGDPTVDRFFYNFGRLGGVPWSIDAATDAAGHPILSWAGARLEVAARDLVPRAVSPEVASGLDYQSLAFESRTGKSLAVYGVAGSMWIQRLDRDLARIETPILVEEPGLRDGVVAAATDRSALVWVRRQASGSGEEIVFAPLVCTSR